MNVKVKIDVDGIGKQLGGMLNRAQLVRGWLNRVAYPIIIAHQRRRWETEGSSEGSAWQPLNPAYRLRKLRMFRAYPGAGQKMLIATSRLVKSVTGDNRDEHVKLVTNTRLEVGTVVSYAKYVDEKRNFTVLSPQTVDELKNSLREYLKTGKE